MLGQVALLVVAALVAVAGVLVLLRTARVAAAFSAWERDAHRRGSLLNEERVEEIERSRTTPGGELVDRVRGAFLGVWLLGLAAVLALTALR